MDKIKASQFAELAYYSRFILLPTEYQQVEWLLNPSSGQYIDTGVEAGSVKGFETKIYMVGVSGSWKAGFGCNSTVAGNFYCGVMNSAGYIALGSSNTTFTANADHILQYLNGTLTIDGDSKGAKSWTAYDSTTLKLFRFGAGNTSQTDTKIYYFKVYDASGLIRDLIPCYRKSDNKTGMYDVLGRTFYPNLGSGEFTLGNNV